MHRDDRSRKDQKPGEGRPATDDRPPALRRWGHLTATRSRLMTGIGILLTVVGLVLAAGAMDRLVLSRFESPGSESVDTRAVLEKEFGEVTPSVLLMVTARQGTVDDEPVAAGARALEEELARRDGVADVASYWSRDGSPTLRGLDGRQALIIARMAGTVTEARTELATISPDFTRDEELFTVRVGGGDEIFRQVAEQSRQDFLRAEMIVFPLVLLLLFAIYRRFAAAALTLGMGLFSVITTLALMHLVTYVTEVSTFAANLALVMGIGLGVDYSLFVINRFREELSSGRPVPEAVAYTVGSAGRTVTFSGLTVLVSLSCLLLFPFPFLRSFAYAGVGTVLTAVFAALVILPAALARLGDRVARKGKEANSRTQSGWWHRTALRMMRHPLRYGVPALVVLLALAAPVLGLTFGTPDERVLPEGVSSRIVQQEIRDNFAAEEMDAIQVLRRGQPGTAANGEEIEATAVALSRIPEVYQVDALTGSYADGNRIAEPGAAADRFGHEEDTWYSVVATHEGLNHDVDRLLSEIRTTAAGGDDLRRGRPVEVRIGGYPAELADFRSQLVDRLPLVLGLVLAVTFLVLFLMTGSLLLPAKATLLNALSLGVMFGALVWIFQEGHLSGVLGFTPTGTIEPSIPILMFCVAFGLSMDYEVLMLSRIKEEYDRTGDTLGAVATGLERSGPLITSAAVIMAASFATYASSGVVFLKMLGLGMVAVIMIDATLIRAVLVPVLMRLAGRANWWAPKPLRALHRRWGLSESEPRPTGDRDPATETEETAETRV
ncbi:MMPL family transporter [Streptomyces sp. PTY087I2]|uniref:MMPL family transporter n=1 Tax=Streptomyces sp. PTY087I2 TaxID=1819298 RepID=UPI0008283AF2|nr:MMPL family transporter [Streptomyces sp. PTY087I2]OCC08226.1 Membrane protein YdfJ [Streptomyces sp. PTY087I2]